METTTASVQETSFELNPNQEANVVDPFEPTAFDDTNVKEPAVTGSKPTSSVPPERMAVLEKDPKFQAELKSRDMTADEYIQETDAKIPAGVDKAELYRENDPVVVNTYAPATSTAMQKKGIEPSSKTGVFSKTLSYTKSADDYIDLDKYSEDHTFKKDLGLTGKDSLTEAGLSLALMETTIKLGEESKAFGYLEELGLGDEFGKFVAKQSFKIACKSGSWKTAEAIVRKYPKEISTSRRERGIKLLLLNYRLKLTVLSEGYFVAAEQMVSGLDVISPGWDKVVRGLDEIFDHRPWLTASEDSLTLLRYGQRTGPAAAMQLQNQFTYEPYGSVAQNQFPALLIDRAKS